MRWDFPNRSVSRWIRLSKCEFYSPRLGFRSLEGGSVSFRIVTGIDWVFERCFRTVVYVDWFSYRFVRDLVNVRCKLFELLWTKLMLVFGSWRMIVSLRTLVKGKWGFRNNGVWSCVFRTLSIGIGWRLGVLLFGSFRFKPFVVYWCVICFDGFELRWWSCGVIVFCLLCQFFVLSVRFYSVCVFH